MKAGSTCTAPPGAEDAAGPVALRSSVAVMAEAAAIAAAATEAGVVGRCRFTVSKPVLKAPLVSALETKM